jgi:UDP-glucose 4-epimerase
VIVSNVGSTDQFARVLPGVDFVFNLAGEISHCRSMEDPERDLALNTTAQLRFLLACREHCAGARIVYASTRQVYGQHERLPVDECHPIQPLDFNGVHKNAATQYHLLLTRRGDLNCLVLRLSNVYGPRMALHLPHQGFLGVYFRMALTGEPILVYGEGEQLRDPVHVKDVVDAFLRAGAARDTRHRIFNIGGSQALSLREIAGMMASSSRGSHVLHVPFSEELRRMEVGSYVSDTRRAQRELGWMPGVLFEDGVRDALAYFREHSEHYLRPATQASEPEMEMPRHVENMRAASVS